MKAIVFDGQLRFSRNHPVPEPGDGEASLKFVWPAYAILILRLLRVAWGFRRYRP